MSINVYEQIPVMESENFLLFVCEMLAAKAVAIAQERIQALEHMGFYLSEEVLIGHDGMKYRSYYVREV